MSTDWSAIRRSVPSCLARSPLPCSNNGGNETRMATEALRQQPGTPRSRRGKLLGEVPVDLVVRELLLCCRAVRDGEGDRAEVPSGRADISARQERERRIALEGRNHEAGAAKPIWYPGCTSCSRASAAATSSPCLSLDRPRALLTACRVRGRTRRRKCPRRAAVAESPPAYLKAAWSALSPTFGSRRPW